MTRPGVSCLGQSCLRLQMHPEPGAVVGGGQRCVLLLCPLVHRIVSSPLSVAMCSRANHSP